MPEATAAPRPPDFVGLGTQGAGTKWWFELLCRHPQIEPPLSGRLALRHFEPFYDRQLRQKGIDRYHRQFARPAGVITGEWSPQYLSSVWTLPLLKRAAPDARLLILLRDPFSRLRSALALYRRRAQPGSPGAFFINDAVNRIRYAEQLHALSNFFGLEQVLIIQYERLLVDPVGEYRRTLRFLGVDDDTIVPARLRHLSRGGRPPRNPERLLQPYGMPTVYPSATLKHLRTPRVKLRPELSASLLDELSDDVRDLEALVDGFDRSLWPEFG